MSSIEYGARYEDGHVEPAPDREYAAVHVEFLRQEYRAEVVYREVSDWKPLDDGEPDRVPDGPPLKWGKDVDWMDDQGPKKRTPDAAMSVEVEWREVQQ